ncbi:metallophosphoesterase [Pontibacter diazotrophicus]|uniref:Metallophosphoesterase n=1 Tax=Pontibacter diazotrophicus TaxID=1400979 RepID=A0A3D8LFI6_9BACT|nr:metallophosphoesterase [Pontibacter diazotrophicus]RDV16143.1 metallophosphoesterase [Pontibacter diazotrophicus]
MRVLIFGDVHGNLPALEKMLEKAGTVDRMICHGDVVNYGPWSNECVQLLQSLDCSCLVGNHEEFFLEGSYPGEHPVARGFFDHCYPLFTQQEIISTYGERLQLGDYQVQHTVNNQYIYPDTDINALELKENYIIGHSHHQFAAETASGKKLVNTGSVGQNRKYINVINYLIYDTEQNALELEALVYEVDQVINKMKQQGYPPLCLDYYLQKKRV